MFFYLIFFKSDLFLSVNGYIAKLLFRNFRKENEKRRNES